MCATVVHYGFAATHGAYGREANFDRLILPSYFEPLSLHSCMNSLQSMRFWQLGTVVKLIQRGYIIFKEVALNQDLEKHRLNVRAIHFQFFLCTFKN